MKYKTNINIPCYNVWDVHSNGCKEAYNAQICNGLLHGVGQKIQRVPVNCYMGDSEDGCMSPKLLRVLQDWELEGMHSVYKTPQMSSLTC